MIGCLGICENVNHFGYMQPAFEGRAAASKPFSDWEDPEMIASASTYRSLPVFLFTPGRGNVVTVERSDLR